VLHTELFLTCKLHTARGVGMVVINGLHRACRRRRAGPERPLIMCFLRHLSEEEAFETLSKAPFL
jgi:adenosine deaminase